jgi:hypothetical protein
MTEPPHDRYAALNTFLGYVIAALAVAMFVFDVLPSLRLHYYTAQSDARAPRTIAAIR